ncbi:unnamed protein product, partial [Iphiclides podalirius]
MSRPAEMPLAAQRRPQIGRGAGSALRTHPAISSRYKEGDTSLCMRGRVARCDLSGLDSPEIGRVTSRARHGALSSPCRGAAGRLYLPTHWPDNDKSARPSRIRPPISPI